ncbi:MAG TPA: HAMP domain-containing histidine kinase [Thermoplasmatales archaeon]|nr:HAMP domain-containing histidine kinase [Thermoplasmatales archaeon]
MKWKNLEAIIKILLVAFLISFSVFIASIYRVRFPEYTFYRHFYYLPAVLSTFWWGRKGLVAPFIMIFLSFFIDSTKNAGKEEFLSLIIESSLLIIVSILVAFLSEEKTRALEKEKKFKLMTAHYFFNPIAIAEGFLHLAMQKASPEITEHLEAIDVAVKRIKKVVQNVVEKGEIRE